jgi:cell division septum initiation protein DivIVA
MSSQPFPRSGSAPLAQDSAAGAISVLQTAERVAERMRTEAQAEAQRLLESARAQAERIREEARADAPKLQSATEALRTEHRRALDQVDALRGTLDALVRQHRGGGDKGSQGGSDGRDGQAENGPTGGGSTANT